jgi:hypothetical protein
MPRRPVRMSVPKVEIVITPRPPNWIEEQDQELAEG